MEWYIPILIYFARIIDVSIGTVRMIFVINGHRWIAAALGFVEVIVWALAVGGVIMYLTNVSALIAYGAGFATGTLVGMTIEEKLAIGHRMLRVVNRQLDIDLSSKLREHGYRVTRVSGEGRSGPVEIAFLAIKRRELAKTIALIAELAPDSFVTVERTDRAALVTLPGATTGRSNQPRWRRYLAVRK
jgi:uncharacterized protein YebE (UPF0316 family)